MDMKAVCEELGSNYKTIIGRFAGNEALWRRFAVKIAEDATYKQLKENIEQNQIKEIEMHAHTLKGVAANLGFDRLAEEAAAIVSAVRTDHQEQIPALFENLSAEYEKVLECVARLD